MQLLKKGEPKQLFNLKKVDCPAGIYVKEVFIVQGYENSFEYCQKIAVENHTYEAIATHGVQSLQFKKLLFCSNPSIQCT